MEPFKVTVKLATPMLVSGPVMLDSLLAWCAVQEAGGEWAAGDTLPLVEREKLGAKYWAASKFFYTSTPAQQTHMTKRTQAAKMARFTDSKIYLNPGSGKNKQYHEMLKPVHASELVAFGVGDIDEVDYLLRRLTHFGKNVRAGYGRVSSVDVEPFKQDWSENIDGQLVRNIPSEKADGMGGYRAPYWDKTKWMPIEFATTHIPEGVLNIINE